jgi:hypothetical protein
LAVAQKGTQVKIDYVHKTEKCLSFAVSGELPGKDSHFSVGTVTAADGYDVFGPAYPSLAQYFRTRRITDHGHSSNFSATLDPLVVLVLLDHQD